VLVVSRGAALSYSAAGRVRSLALAAAALGGWLVLADFQVHYFDFIGHTGGCAHETFRTAAEEPKSTALKIILRHRGPGRTWIVAGQYWNLWPLRYLSWRAKEEICVVSPQEAAGRADFQRAAACGQVWHVEFAGSDALSQARVALAGRTVEQWSIADSSGQPTVCVLHATGPAPDLPPEGP